MTAFDLDYSEIGTLADEHPMSKRQMRENMTNWQNILTVSDLGNIGDEGCPCGEVVCEGYRIETHCWKSGACKEHPFSCVHVRYEKGRKTEAIKHAKKIKRYITKAYRTDCAFKEEK